MFRGIGTIFCSLPSAPPNPQFSNLSVEYHQESPSFLLFLYAFYRLFRHAYKKQGMPSLLGTCVPDIHDPSAWPFILIFCPFRCHSDLSSVNTFPLQRSLCPFVCKNSTLLLSIWPYGLSLFPYSCHSALFNVKTRPFCWSSDLLGCHSSLTAVTLPFLL